MLATGLLTLSPPSFPPLVLLFPACYLWGAIIVVESISAAFQECFGEAIEKKLK